MNILVCVKQVIDLDARLCIDDSGRALLINENTSYRMNEPDAYALEMALRLRDAAKGGVVHAISLGPARVEAVVRRAMGMGADSGAVILTRPGLDLDAFATAHCIASYAREKRFDLILAGVQSEDAMQGAVGPMIAALLGRPCATGVVTASRQGGAEIEAVREIEGGRRERLALALPAVLTIQTGPEKPRYPSLSNMLRANKAELESVGADSLDPPASRLEVVRMEYPRQIRAGRMLTGDTDSKARQLWRILGERNVL